MSAIKLMEQAFEKVKNAGKILVLLDLSNLADMYGHAGRVKEAYDAYINVLNKDSSYIYALKGIAWIAYSMIIIAKKQNGYFNLFQVKPICLTCCCD